MSVNVLSICRVFPRPFTHGGICSPPYGGTSAGGQSVNGVDS